MIIIDHLGLGVFNSYVTFQKNSKKIIFIGIFFSIICDIDILWSGNPGSLRYLQFHRVWSHSLILIIPLIMVVTVFGKNLRYKFFQDLTTFQIITIQVLGFGSHIILDLFTPYGVPLFYPILNYRYSFDVLHDFDPITSAISVLSIILILFIGKKVFNKKLLLIIMISYFGYLGFAIINKYHHYQIYSEKFPASGDYKLKVIPKTFWRWKGLVNYQDKIIVINNISEVDTIKSLSDDIISKDFRGNKILKMFKNYARFPAMDKVNDSTFQFYNLAYSKENYKLTVITDQDGSIRSYQTTSFDLIDK